MQSRKHGWGEGENCEPQQREPAELDPVQRGGSGRRGPNRGHHLFPRGDWDDHGQFVACVIIENLAVKGGTGGGVGMHRSPAGESVPIWA
ncbi:hypothetical protein GCM10009872_51930 [Actinopolymorpha rutila]